MCLCLCFPPFSWFRHSLHNRFVCLQWWEFSRFSYCHLTYFSLERRSPTLLSRPKALWCDTYSSITYFGSSERRKNVLKKVTWNSTADFTMYRTCWGRLCHNAAKRGRHDACRVAVRSLETAGPLEAWSDLKYSGKMSKLRSVFRYLRVNGVVPVEMHCQF